MSEGEGDYEIGYGKPPAASRFRKGQSGNPRGRRGTSLSSLLVAALNEPVSITVDGERRRVTKREAIVTHMVDKSASADLHATKMLIDMLKEVEQKAAATRPEQPKLVTPDWEVVERFVARLRRQIQAETAALADRRR
jgi:hypothetical protein